MYIYNIDVDVMRDSNCRRRVKGDYFLIAAIKRARLSRIGARRARAFECGCARADETLNARDSEAEQSLKMGKRTRVYMNRSFIYRRCLSRLVPILPCELPREMKATLRNVYILNEPVKMSVCVCVFFAKHKMPK